MIKQQLIILLLFIISFIRIPLLIECGGEYEWATIHLKVYATSDSDLMGPEETLEHLHRLVKLNHDPYDEGLARALIGASELSETKCTTRAFNKLNSIIRHFSRPNLYLNVVNYLENSRDNQVKFCKEKLKHSPIY